MRIPVRCMPFLAVLAAVVTSASSAAADDGPLTFERDVRPILKAHCFQCHGEGEKTRGGLDVRLRRLLAGGGDSGAAIVPGKSHDSLLLKRVRSGEMPPGKKAPKLTKQQVAVIERWIAGGAKTARPEPEKLGAGAHFTEEERQFWSFQPVRRPQPPTPKNAARVRTPIDAFLLERLEKHGHSFAAEADKRTLLRRAYFDLIGLPPSPEETERFMTDESPDAYEKLIDRLLAAPHYGERWGRHWLDVAGYADSDGATGDKERPHAYRYRDYVIKAFNADKSFDQFIREQLAGDEMVGPLMGTLTPEQAEKLIATGFLQMAPDGTQSAEDRVSAHDLLVADTIKIVSSSLLGLTVGCARCHDHRFDPISQDDYYRFRAIFEPALAARNWQGKARLIPYATAEDQKNAEVLLRYQELGAVERAVERQLAKLPEKNRAAARDAHDTPEDERTEQQKKLLLESNLNITLDNVEKIDRLAPMDLRQIRQKAKARQNMFLQTITEAPGNPPKTLLFHRGDPKNPKHELAPGELSILQEKTKAVIPANDPSLPSTGRRLAYAKHLTSGKHPLVARVIVNRVWMLHFGRGLCDTPADFGTHGGAPSHPELLDWLASEFMGATPGWSLKRMHRQMMTSTAYRQGLRRNAELERIDPANRLLGGFNARRLEAEIVRDAILAVSGKLNRKAFGTPVPVMRDPTGEIVIGHENLNAGVPLATVPMFGEEFRRSVYVQARRTMPMTFMQMFDAPAMEPNCEFRHASTVAPQSLVLMNSPFVLRQSLFCAERVRKDAGKDAREQAAFAWHLAYARDPSDEELTDAVTFLKARAEYFRKHPPTLPENSLVPGSRSMMRGGSPDALLIRFTRADPDLLALALLCQMLTSSNEFLYVK